MDEHQRRVLRRLLDEVDAFHRGELTPRRLVTNLCGLVDAAGIEDERLLDGFWDRVNDLLSEIAPSWFDSDVSVPGGEARFREWVAGLLHAGGEERT